MRQPRLLFENGIYHVINRGNYRLAIFDDPGTRDAFVKCLLEAAEKFGWVVYAFVVMRNHFHLAIRTTLPNLPESVGWLETTFSARFNLFRAEHGHVFQGRYKAWLVQPGRHLCTLVNYIHLNPVMKSLVPADLSHTYPWSSLRRFVEGNRPLFLRCEEWMAHLGIRISRRGWLEYRLMLAAISGSESRQKEAGFDNMTRGWAIGDDDWKAGLLSNESTAAAITASVGPERDALRQERWRAAAAMELSRAGRTSEEARASKKGADWKIEIAVSLRARDPVPFAWIARELNMGTAGSVRAYVYRFLRDRGKR